MSLRSRSRRVRSTAGSFLKVRTTFLTLAYVPLSIAQCLLYLYRILPELSNSVIKVIGADMLTFGCAIAEDNMNVQLKDITVTARDGRVSHLDQVYIRGSHVRFFIVPDMLRYALLPRITPSRPYFPTI
jgi:hypothetical protein